MVTLRKLVSFLYSMKAGLFLLATIGIISAIGSYFVPKTYYRSNIFELLVLLFLNMTFCTVNQLNIYFRSAKNIAPKALHIRRIGILLIHAGMVIILIGGTMNSIGGKSVTVRITEGETVEIADIVPNAHPFALRVNKFTIEFNEDASPSQYISDVSVIEEEKSSQEYNISVNHPLVYEGVKVYQSSFGYLIDIEGKNGTEWSEQELLGERQFFKIPNTDKAVLVYKYVPDFDQAWGMKTKSYQPNNPRIIYATYINGSRLEIGYATLGDTIELEDHVTVTFHGVKPFTGLVIKKDPGLALARAGGIMLMVGACLVLINNKRKA